jgi:xanthine dehydrogenase accessory factor
VIADELTRRAAALKAEGEQFVVATVVRAQRPTSVRAGDAALVLGDGTIEGFVGGTCAEQSVRLHALRALETGEGLLLRILPGDGEAPADEGAVTVTNPCLSGGALEVFLDPVPASPRVLVVGETPIARALARLGGELDLDVVDGACEPREGDLALVVAAHGRAELGALRGALEAGLPYVGLVASRRRGAAVADELRAAGVAEERVAALDTPAGLDLGARTPGEIALSILARIVAVRRAGADHGIECRVVGHMDQQVDTRRAEGAVATAVDPVCGMTVAVTDDTPRVEHGGRLVHFCCEGCAATFAPDPARFVGVG